MQQQVLTKAQGCLTRMAQEGEIMSEEPSPSLFSARVDRQVRATQQVSQLALVVVTALLVTFGTTDGVAAGVEVAEPARAFFLPFEPYEAPAANVGG